MCISVCVGIAPAPQPLRISLSTGARASVQEREYVYDNIIIIIMDYLAKPMADGPEGPVFEFYPLFYTIFRTYALFSFNIYK